jgi:hypothetical protein
VLAGSRLGTPPCRDPGLTAGGIAALADISNTLHGKFDRSVSLLAWGYNEEALVADFLDRAIDLLNRTVETGRSFSSTMGGSDGTGAIADECARREPRLRVLHNERNLNVGRSARRAAPPFPADHEAACSEGRAALLKGLALPWLN